MTDRIMDCGDLGSFLLGELDEEESAAFLEHVAGCPSCSKELPTLWPAHEGLLLFPTRPGMFTTLAGVSDGGPFPEFPFELRADLKARVLAAAFEARPPQAAVLADTRAPALPPSPRADRIRRWAPTAAVSFASLLAGTLIGVRLSAFSAPAAVHLPPARLVSEARLESTLASPPGARGVVMVVRRAGQVNLIVTVQNLAPAKGPAWYHVWLLKAGVRRSAGVFTVNPKGQGALSVVLPTGLSFDAVGITREPMAADSSPKGPKVLGAKIQGA